MRAYSILIPVLFVSLQVQGQDKSFRYFGNAHVYFSSGVCAHDYTHVGVGGGGEGFVWRGVTVGGDISYNKFINDLNFGMTGLNAGYHFVNRSRPGKFDPFVSFTPLAAYFNRGGMGSAGGLGGGLNYWFKERVGLRTEVRAMVLAAGEEALIVFRIGINFR